MSLLGTLIDLFNYLCWSASGLGQGIIVMILNLYKEVGVDFFFVNWEVFETYCFILKHFVIVLSSFSVFVFFLIVYVNTFRII